MSTKDNEVNRTINGDTAEGHVVRRYVDESDEGKKAAKKHASVEEAEGHRFRGGLIDADDAGKKAAKKQASIDDEAEGHRIRI